MRHLQNAHWPCVPTVRMDKSLTSGVAKRQSLVRKLHDGPKNGTNLKVSNSCIWRRTKAIRVSKRLVFTALFSAACVVPTPHAVVWCLSSPKCVRMMYVTQDSFACQTQTNQQQANTKLHVAIMLRPNRISDRPLYRPISDINFVSYMCNQCPGLTFYKLLCCRKEAARCLVSVSSYIQQYQTSSTVFYC